MHRPSRARRGAALVLALCVTAIMSMLLSGILLLSVSHLALSDRNSDYANALNLAEAGINWELWKISRDPATADVAPATVTLPAGSDRSYTVRAATYPSGDPWSPPSPLWIISTGTVDGVSRTVRVRAKGYGLFGEYALFGIDQLSVGGNATINGASGSDGNVDINGNPNFNGNFWYCGSAYGDSVAGLVTGTINHSPLPEEFPTVNEVANDWARDHFGATPPQTIDFFRTHNDNAQIVTTTGAPVTLHSFTLDSHVFPADGVLVLPPGDYYFEKLELPSNNTLKIDTAAGQVNIWIGPSGGTGKADTINGSMLFTAPDATKFRLYDGSARPLKLNGTMDFYGCVLAYNGPSKMGQYYGAVEINGTGNIVGSVIGYDVSRTTGNATITFASTGGAPVPGDPIIYYGFDQSWEEVGPA